MLSKHLHILLVTLVIPLICQGTQLRTCALSGNPEAKVMGQIHRDQLLELLEVEPGKMRFEKIDVIDFPGRLETTHLARSICQFLAARVPENTVEVHQPTSAFQSTPNSDQIVIRAYVLSKSDAVKSKDLALTLFPEEFQASGVPDGVAIGSHFRMKEVAFHGNSALFKAPDCEELYELEALMKRYPNISLRIEGHVNGRMGRHYLKKAARTNPEHIAYKNAKHLSLARAKSVKRFLVEQGIDAHRIQTLGKGGSERIYRNPSSSSQNAANRRIEVFVLPLP